MKYLNVERRFDLDWLRVLAFTLLIFYHSGLIFTDWIISNSQKSAFIEIAAFIVSQWRLPLLCIISGAGVFYALEKYSYTIFLKDRLLRLSIPLIFASFFINPAQLFYHDQFVGRQVGSYLSFQMHVFSFDIYPRGNLHWIHLWFIAYLLFYSIITVPFFCFLKSNKGRRLTFIASTFIGNTKLYMAILPIPLIFIDILVWIYLNPNGSKFISLLVFFSYGYLFFTNTDIVSVSRKYYRFFLIVSLTTSLIIALTADVSGFGDVYIHSGKAVFIFGKILKNVNIFAWLFAMVGLASKYLNFKSDILKYANEAVYPFYILHQTFIIVIGFYVIQWQTGIAIKFWCISIGTLISTFVFYEFIIRRFQLTRMLFGLKPKANRSKKNGDAASKCSLVIETKQLMKEI